MKRPTDVQTVVLTVVAMLIGAGCGLDADEPASVTSPDHHVTIILIDCLRADHVGAYGYSRNTTPYIDRLAADSVLFEQAIAPTNWTKPSVVSLFTGLYLSQHLVTEGRIHKNADTQTWSGYLLNEEFVTFAEAMSSAGFATAGLINQGHLPAYMGFAQGFDIYQHNLLDGYVYLRFKDWVNGLRGSRFFAYLHLLDLHFPYRPLEGDDIFNDHIAEKVITPLMKQGQAFRRLVEDGAVTTDDIDELVGLYDGNVLEMDRQVAAYVDFLKSTGLYDDTMIVITSDHGEALFEHDLFEHGGENLYSEVVRVPLIIKFPENRHAGTRIRAPVQLIDLMPTVLDYFDVPVSEGLGGRSLLPLIAGEVQPWPVLTETSDLEAKKALYVDDYKFIFDLRSDAVEAFAYADDPLDKVDLAAELGDGVIARARAHLDAILGQNALFAAQTPARQEARLREAEVERLRALGYIR